MDNVDDVERSLYLGNNGIMLMNPRRHSLICSETRNRHPPADFRPCSQQWMTAYMDEVTP
jgi:hypothetical protein